MLFSPVNKTSSIPQSNAICCNTLPNVNTDTITQLEFSVEGDPLLVSSSWDQTIRIWKFEDWSTYQNPKFLDGIKDPSNNAILRFCFGQSSTKIYYGTTAGEIKEYDFLNKRQITKIKKIPLVVSNYNNQPVELPPSKYIVSGLKWSEHYNLIVSLTTNGYSEKSYPHSYIGYVDPTTDACTLCEIQYIKIINIDLVDDRLYVISISIKEMVSQIFYINLPDLNSVSTEYTIVKSQIQSIPTSISGLPQGLDGYILSTVEGFVEIVDGTKSFYDCVFKKEIESNKVQTFPANCLSTCKFDKKIAMVCSRNEMTLFNLENALYKTFVPFVEKCQIKNSITACAFSPNGSFFAVAYGYDWALGAEKMKKIDHEPLILIGTTPDSPTED